MRIGFLKSLKGLSPAFLIYYVDNRFVDSEMWLKSLNKYAPTSPNSTSHAFLKQIE